MTTSASIQLGFLLILLATVYRVSSWTWNGPTGSKEIVTADGPINAAVEQHITPEGDMMKMLIAMMIPYASPPVGNLRFKPPQKPMPWYITRNANRNNGLQLVMCPQTLPPKHPSGIDFSFRAGVGKISAHVMSEDCLILNVYAPLKDDGDTYPAKSLAVMVFIHGGSFKTGSANANLYEGTPLSMATRTIVVTLNYRLGALGFLRASSAGESTANVGLMDQLMALKWVRSNVAKFGGDPGRVTIFGESAGSASVNYLMMSPMNDGVFQKVVMQSGLATAYWAYAEPEAAEKASLALAVTLGCADMKTDMKIDPTILTCLREKDASSIVAGAKTIEEMVYEKDMVFIPTTDDEFLPYGPKEGRRREAEKSVEKAVEVMMGFNADEGSLFMAMSGMKEFGPGVKADDSLSRWVFDAFVKKTVEEAKEEFVMDEIRQRFFKNDVQGLTDLITDRMFKCQIAQTASKLSGNRKVHTYLWDWHFGFIEKHFPLLGAFHALELIPLFGQPYISEEKYSKEEKDLSGKMMHWWGRFANGSAGGPFYQPIPAGAAYVISNKENNGMVERLEIEQCDFLGCLPSLAEYAKTGNMNDWSCMEFVVGGTKLTTPSWIVIIFSLALSVRFF